VRLSRLILLVVGISSVVACGSSPHRAGLPAIALERVDGSSPWHVDELDGPAVINLWATWCVPCKKELPLLQATYEASGGEVAFAGVNIGDRPESVEQYVADVGVTYPQYLDSTGALSTALRITGLPATVFVERDGTYIIHAGTVDRDELATWIARVRSES
jgi:cytochrome c biogenesis protein CcmG, thiol:disulfide interchange protein DsbE